VVKTLWRTRRQGTKVEEALKNLQGVTSIAYTKRSGDAGEGAGEVRKDIRNSA